MNIFYQVQEIPSPLTYTKEPLLASTQQKELPVVNTAFIEDIGEVSPEKCTAGSPCNGLRRSIHLHVEISNQGYAAAYLQDKGLFYMQNGCLIINDMKEGDMPLWPGDDTKSDGIYKLYILSSDKEIARSEDSNGLYRLPEGRKWGPVYLKVKNSPPPPPLPLKGRWDYLHRLEYVGKVWTKVIPNPSSKGIPHYYTVRWGDWIYYGKIENFNNRPHIFLVYTKQHAGGIPAPISFCITPESCVSFGEGEPPDTNLNNIEYIDYNWRHVNDPLPTLQEWNPPDSFLLQVKSQNNQNVEQAGKIDLETASNQQNQEDLQSPVTYNITQETVFIRNVSKKPIAVRIAFDNTDPFGNGEGNSTLNNNIKSGTEIKQKISGNKSIQIWAWDTLGNLVCKKDINLPINNDIANALSVEITNPIQDGIDVGQEIDVKGKAIISNEDHLWVLIHRTKGFKNVWWPQDEGKINPKTHEWEVTVAFGSPKDIGYEFEIAVITVNEQEHNKLQDYRNKAMVTGDWRPIPMPPTMTAPVIRTVKKIGHFIYNIEIIRPGNAPQKFSELEIPMEVNFSMDVTPNDSIWILGFDVTNNRNYPLRKLDMIRGQRYWKGTVNLPANAMHEEWILKIIKVDTEASAKLFGVNEKSKMPIDVLPDDVRWLASKTITYGE